MTDVVTPAINQASTDPHVRLSMELGALLEGGNLTGPWNVGDSGTSFGPFQIHLPAHPGVTAMQANDPRFSANFMVSAYQAAASQIPASLWQSDPELAAEQTAFHAERPSVDYFTSHGSSSVHTAYKSALAAEGISGGSPGGTPAYMDPLGTIGDVVSDPGAFVGAAVSAPLDALSSLSPGNLITVAIKALISSGLVLRGTLMVAGLIILFIGLSQISKGDQTAAQTAGSGVSTVKVHVVSASKKTAGKVAEGAAA